MKHEFKVTKSKDQTVYTLESASSGGTSSGSVASVSTALGGMQRRPADSIFAQEGSKDKVDASKPRNFVAKNAKMGGAGKMKDKSKTIPRHEKHKKPVAEGLPQTLRKVVPGYAKREIDKKMDAGKFGKTDADKDANFQRYKKIQDKIKDQGVAEEWSKKYKSSINCSHPKGFSQKAHCAGKKKHDESIEMEAVCPDCGMCEAHGNSKIYDKCWTGFRKVPGKKRGEKGSCEKISESISEGPNDGREDNFTIDDIKRLEKIRDLETLKAQAKELIKGKPVRRMKPEKISWFYNHIDTLRNPMAVIKMMYDLMLAGEGNRVIGSRNSMSSNSYRSKFGEDHEIQMAGSELQSIAKNAVHLLDLVRKYSEQEGLQAWQQSKITKAADYLNSVLQSISGEQSGMEEARNNYHANTTGFSRGPRDSERHDLDTQVDPRETMMWNLTVDGKPLNPEPIMGRSNLIKFGKQQAAAGVDLSNAVISPVKEMEEDSYMMELAAKLAEKIPQGADVDYYIKDFAKSTAPQFKGKSPAKRKQMAIAAYYGSKQKKK